MYFKVTKCKGTNKKFWISWSDNPDVYKTNHQSKCLCVGELQGFLNSLFK